MSIAANAMPSKYLRQLCGTVLAMEAIVIGLAIPVAIVLEHLRHGVAGGVGGGLAVCALLLSGLVGRPRMAWALVAGSVLQVLVIAAGHRGARHVHPRRDLRRALGHRHLASPPPSRHPARERTPLTRPIRPGRPRLANPKRPRLANPKRPRLTSPGSLCLTHPCAPARASRGVTA